MAAEAGFNYTMPLEVYLQTVIVRGVLATNQDRLSSYLLVREGDEVISLTDATLENLSGKAVVSGPDEYVVYLREVFLIADLSPDTSGPRSGMEGLYVKKDTSKTLIGVGHYLVQGNIHLLPGNTLHDVLLEKSQFVPVTDATMLGSQEHRARTYLVNRNKIGFMTAITDGLVEL